MSNKITINSESCEFGYELISVLPYSYNLHLQGKLEKTISSFDTKCLYFFSPNHEETNIKRSWDSVINLKKKNFPNINIHNRELDWDKFSPPPLKEFYLDKSINFEKETLVIFNRYNKEWGDDPINYLDLETLDKLFYMLKEKYQIVYLNLNSDNRYFDHAEPLFLNDEKVLNKHPEVLTFSSLKIKYPQYSVNELQCRIFSKCEKYISSNGGQLILSAYFGGENIIFSKKCYELNSDVNSFYGWYHKLGGGVFQHVNNYNSLLELVKQKWVDDKPLINILIRTSERPNYFKDCLNSIYSQTYKNYNIIVGVDTKNTYDYSKYEKCRTINYTNENFIITPKQNLPEYGNLFIPNSYMNKLMDEVVKGYIVYIDDDDVFENEKSLEEITNSINGDDDIIFWKVKFNHRVVPDSNFFGKPPVLTQIDTAGFSFNIKNRVDWEPYTNGDFRVVKKLYEKISNKKYINKILVKGQRNVKLGRGLRDDKKNHSLSVIIPTYNNIEYLDESLNSIINSGKDQNIEILVGIDGCEKTLNYIKQKTYPDFVKFYYFNSNNGPYVVKNTLSQIVNSDNILFFDSDDIMGVDLISKIISLSKSYQVVRPKYSDFTNNGTIVGKNYGEGVFMIYKKLFLEMNGFEPWKVAADTEFMNRLRLKNIKTYLTPEVLFKRRIHSHGLTSRKDTGYGSSLRNQYIQMMNNKKGLQNPSKLHTEDFKDITTNVDNFILPEKKKLNLEPILNKQPRKVVETKIIKPEKKQLSNDILNLLKQKDNIPPIPQKKSYYTDVNPAKTQQEQRRQMLIDQKKNTTLSQLTKEMKLKKSGGNIGGKFSI